MPVNGTDEPPVSINDTLTLPARFVQQLQFGKWPLYTGIYARIACINYKTSVSGSRLFNHCLTDLPVTVATDDKLQFGWDESSFFRSNQIHLFEYEHLLLTSALCECLPETYAASVLYCLGAQYEDGDLINPPVASWKAFLHAVNGFLTSTEFALKVDERQRLDPYRVSSAHSHACTNSSIEPKEFASALRHLLDLSRAGEGRLTLLGGNFLGWFAAFGELFLDVRVNVLSADGGLLNSNHSESKAVLDLIFVDGIKNLTVTLEGRNNGSTALKLMCGPDAEDNVIPRIPFTGKVAWESVLPCVFGDTFHKLAHTESKTLVQSIAGVALLFHHIAADPVRFPGLISEENRLNTSSYGLGLIQTLCNWFPELRHLQGRLERIQKLSYEEAVERCNQGATGLVGLCRCTICYNPHYATEDTGKAPHSFCLLAIMETILNLALAMSRLTAAPKVYPSRAGVLCIYQRQVQKLINAKNVSEPNFYRVRVLFGNDYNANYSVRLQVAVALFSGSWPKDDLPDNLVGLSHEGMCAYVTQIQRSSARPEDAGLIRVQNGSIWWKKKVFSRATLGSPQGLDHADYEWEEASCAHLEEALWLK